MCEVYSSTHDRYVGYMGFWRHQRHPGGPGRGRVREERLGRIAVTSFPSRCACMLSAHSPRFAAAVLYLLLQSFVAANCISKKPPVGAAKVHFAKEQHYFCSSEKKRRRGEGRKG